jgi:hypothetical protein
MSETPFADAVESDLMLLRTMLEATLPVVVDYWNSIPEPVRAAAIASAQGDDE